MININIIIAILVISFCTSILVCAINKRKLKKEFEDQLKVESTYRHQLEERYIELYQEYKEHYHKHH